MERNMYLLIQPAVRRKNKIQEGTGALQHHPYCHGEWSGPDVVLMVIDAVEGVTEQDAKIAGIAR